MTTDAFTESEVRRELRGIVDHVFKTYDAEYWRQLDRDNTYPEKFVEALTETSLLGALVPEEYGGLGLSMGDASVILEQINRNGGSSGPIHAQMYIMGTVLRHGSEEQKQAYLPGIAAGTTRLQSFAVTEPTTGTDTTQLKTTAVRQGDSYVVNGQKVWISRVQHTDLMLLLARTTPKDLVTKRSDGLSVFLIDLRELEGVTVNPIRTMVNHETNEVFFDNVRIPASSLIGEEGKGFAYIMDGMNAERIMVAAECIGDGRWFIDKTTKYASERIVFDRPIGANQGVQFPIARAHVNIEAADLMRWRASDKFDAGLDCGAEANMAKLLASEASWEAANCALQYHGGFGMAEEYDVERKFRETRLYQIAPISTNMILSYVGQHVLKMPRSY
ncbi:acyl-CoA dehydrogenase family protein [Rhodococcus erythropolis]|uniref:acyl-CoA dehydrogenase family protein n=1 Tax=Rhodococcus erythropolis TaxID=1833 RepID=UPI002948E75F|nr:acyl-CoA dehydrogenase family protein [Rhodococcus erythropolis]MDV6212757.1 acyl-CoA dehydrogenase family protein [Rhodococcus erythropolis]